VTTPIGSSVPVDGPSPWHLMVGGSRPDPYTYQALDQYYAGEQALSFLPPDIQRATMGRLRPLIINWPRLVIDSIEERLDVEGFRFGTDMPADKRCWDIWQQNNLDEASQQCHVEALLHARAYALVWADELDNGQPRISIESSAQMSVVYFPGSTKIAHATKNWVEGDTSFLTIYRPDIIERYMAETSSLASDMSYTSSAWELREEPISHDLGEVPVVPFVNRPRLSRPFGESELADVIPLADAVNKLATDMMVTSEFHATKRRWATGLEIPQNSGSNERFAEDVRQKWDQATTGKTWLAGQGVQFGEFTEASLSNFVNGIELLTGSIAALAGLPPHYLGLTNAGNPASADAIRSSEAALVKRAQRKQRVFGGSWERVMRLALRVQDPTLPAGAASMETIWGNPETPTVAQKVDAATKLDGIGMPFRQNLEDLNYTPTQIERILTMRADDALTDVAKQLAAADQIVKQYGVSRSAALSAVGLNEAALYESKVEAHEVAPPPPVRKTVERDPAGNITAIVGG
jgi:hypothetical protein